MLNVSPLLPGESYATVEQIRDVPDRARYPVEIPQWQYEDGKPFKLLLQAPSFTDATEIDRASKTPEGENDDAAFVLETCLRVIIEPTFTRPQLDILRAKNATVLDDICDMAWRLCRIPPRTLEQELRTLAGLAAEATQGTPAARSKRAPRRARHADVD